MGELKRAVVVGVISGTFMGFIDTYGYAVTGYTTSELAGIVASILVLVIYRAIYGRQPSIFEHVLGVIISFGISVSTAITSGMYITYTMLAEVGNPTTLKLPEWLYFTGGGLNFATLSFYLYATAVSASGALIAYVFHKHYIEIEKLPFPIGSAMSVMIEVGKVMRRRALLIAVVGGAVAEFAVIMLGNPSVDLTQAMQSMLPGSSVALSADVFIFLLALLLPLNTSLGVGLGNIVTFTVLTPILVSEGLLISLPSMSSSDLASAAAPYTASMIIGFLVISSTIYFYQARKALKETVRYLGMSKYLLRYFLIALGLIASTALPLYLICRPPPLLLAVLPAYIGLQIFLALVTIKVVGEAGTASQSTLPVATLTLFASGARHAMPYVLLDPYTGVPMPQFVAGASLNAIKAGKSLDVDPEVPVFWLMVAMLVGAPITLMYGHALLSVFGVSSPKLNLLRWVPVVTWMDSVYRGNFTSFDTFSIILGAVFAASVFLILKALRLGGVSLYAVLIGTTLTPDVGLLFLIAAAIKYVAFRAGTDVYESLLAYTSIALAGAGIGVALSVAASLAGVG
ncbi:MAG: hypothetical protein J7L55_02475 [Desulfurococcales archaeon]|nr:hypothetical protein [Desulfurococcales archaeon]